MDEAGAVDYAALMLCSMVRGCRMVGLLAGVSLSGCGSSDSSPQPIAPAKPKAGTQTMRFRNDTTGDIFINWTFLAPDMSPSDGASSYRLTSDCTTVCSTGCSCAQCGAPQSAVKQIAAGTAIEVSWNGNYYVQQSCGEQPSCHCDEVKVAAFGAYQVQIDGARARTSAGPSTGSDPTVIKGAALDPQYGTCTAKGSVTVSEQDATIEIPFACGP